jgi:hypothetical protein
MASSIDTANRKAGSSQAEISHNHAVAHSQGEKSSFRAHKVALSADKFNPSRLDNAIQQKLAEWGT